jgi:hypothetical protein
MEIYRWLAHVKKMDLWVITYLNKVKALANALSSIDHPLRDYEFTSYILNSLYDEYESFIVVNNGSGTPMPPRDLYACLLNIK